ERAGAGAPWPGKTVAPAAALPVVEAPRPSAYVAMLHARKHLKNRSATPRFDRTGFPMDPKDHAARRDRLRSRVMTTTVVATVVAAPVIALWSAYRGAPLTGEGRDGSAVSAADNETGGAGTPYDPYENAGNARPDGGSRFTGEDSLPEVSAEIISKGAGPTRDPAAHGEGRLTVRTRTAGSATLITLTASKAGPVSWTAATDRPWVTLSRTSGRLPAGGSITIRALADHARQPAGPWTAHLTIAPSGAVVALHGYGAKAPTPGASPRGGSPHPRPIPPRTGTPDPDPSTPGPSTPTPDPGDPTPTPTEPDPAPDPAGSSGPPAPPKGPSTPPRAD
ncbi:BACON domain-containing protein, partial [Streptomyces sp. SID9727]|nr:BACON domain-containing protein [Streptomyces sp. SID9727]